VLLANWVKARKTGGLTITGGEPLAQPRAVLALLQELHGSGIGVILLTGFKREIFTRQPFASIYDLCDAIVAGPFRQDEYLAQGLRGSGNKEYLFVTDRYSRGDFDGIPDAEVVIRPDGSAVASGMIPLSLTAD
jgi:anaerobic ribonucleoside-triphosphate reductase activating protein